MSTELRDVTGFRGEKIVELCLTEYETFPAPLFRPGFLGDKWPAIDYYVELAEIVGKRLYFFAQVKSTATALTKGARTLPVSAKKRDVERLVQIPGPTYVLGVHEPSKRVFIRAVHAGTPIKALQRIPLTHELTSANLKALHDEVSAFWSTAQCKPTTSVFA